MRLLIAWVVGELGGFASAWFIAHGLGYRKGRADAAQAVWDKADGLRGTPFRSGQVGIEYVNGMEDAADVAQGGAR